MLSSRGPLIELAPVKTGQRLTVKVTQLLRGFENKRSIKRERQYFKLTITKIPGITESAPVHVHKDF